MQSQTVNMVKNYKILLFITTSKLFWIRKTVPCRVPSNENRIPTQNRTIAPFISINPYATNDSSPVTLKKLLRESLRTTNSGPTPPQEAATFDLVDIKLVCGREHFTLDMILNYDLNYSSNEDMQLQHSFCNENVTFLHWFVFRAVTAILKKNKI